MADAPLEDVAVEAAARALHDDLYSGCVQWDDDPSDTATTGSESGRLQAMELARRAVRAYLDAPPGGTQPPGPSDEACKAAFEHWFCSVGRGRWDTETKAVQDDWRESLKKAYAVDRLRVKKARE